MGAKDLDDKGREKGCAGFQLLTQLRTHQWRRGEWCHFSRLRFTIDIVLQDIEAPTKHRPHDKHALRLTRQRHYTDHAFDYLIALDIQRTNKH